MLLLHLLYEKCAHSFIDSSGRELPDDLLQSISLESAMSTSHAQPSSFDSSSNRLSPARPTSSRLPDPSQGYSYRSTKTPSTSLSNTSDQERAITENDCSAKTRAVGYGLEVKDHARSASALPASPTQHLINHSVAPKRMANGDIKSPAYSLPTSPVSSSPYEHSRSSTKTFPDSRIIEVCENNTAAFEACH